MYDVRTLSLPNFVVGLHDLYEKMEDGLNKQTLLKLVVDLDADNYEIAGFPEAVQKRENNEKDI